MPKRRERRDVNTLAFEITRKVADEWPPESKEQTPTEARQKGGKHGGAARAEKLTPEQRSEIARKAARARWQKRSHDSE